LEQLLPDDPSETSEANDGTAVKLSQRLEELARFALLEG
jgi:hypothetical protein